MAGCCFPLPHVLGCHQLLLPPGRCETVEAVRPLPPSSSAAPPPGSGVLGSAVRSGPAHGTGLGGGHAGLEPPIQAWPAVKVAAPGHDWGGNRVQADVAIEAGVAAGRRGHPLQWGGRQRRHRYFQCLQVKDNLSYFLFYSSIISSCTYRPFSTNDFFNLKETRSHLDA